MGSRLNVERASMKRSPFRWLAAISLLLVSGLCYAVYFTELGKPEPTESSKSITLYNKTAAPTIFIPLTQIPTVEMDWAYATDTSLKIALKIRGLDINGDASDWICDPYLVIDKPVQYQLHTRQFGLVFDTAGKFTRAMYGYEIDAGDYTSLKAELDLTIGPCGEYFNFPEANITPTVMPKLIGNYHLAFQVPIEVSTSSASETVTPASTAPARWNDIPIYPGALEFSDDRPGYHYTVDTADPYTLMTYYRREMSGSGWDLVSIEDVRGVTLHPGYTLLYNKGKAMLSIDIFVFEKVTHVVVAQEP